jgi:hypothetical protein
MTTPSMPTPLVIVRCAGKNCRKILGSLDTMPDDWSGHLRVLRCKKCVMPPRRLVGVLAQQKAAGFAAWMDIPLAKLRPHATKAMALGRPEEVTVPPFRKLQ